jgi:hypothetical protein
VQNMALMHNQSVKNALGTSQDATPYYTTFLPFCQRLPVWQNVPIKVVIRLKLVYLECHATYFDPKVR